LRFLAEFVLIQADKCGKKECSKSISDSREKEKIVSGRQHCLHRAIIDTSLVNRMARKIPRKQGTTASVRELNPYSAVYQVLINTCFSWLCTTRCRDQDHFSGFPKSSKPLKRFKTAVARRAPR
jgi:hypothetical protein